MTGRSPNAAPFQRSSFARLFGTQSKLHVLRREVMQQFFERVNPEGWWHDLGAQDVFLDNLGIVVEEQLQDRELRRRYLGAFLEGHCLPRWSLLRRMVLQRRPWWGTHFNAKHRKAATGEPRGLLRFWPEDRKSLLAMLQSLGLWPSEESPQGLRSWQEEHLWDLLFPETDALVPDLPDLLDLRGWAEEADRLLFPARPDQEAVPLDAPPSHLAFGVIPPPGVVPREDAWLLPVTQATPDLPARCGASAQDPVHRAALKGRDQERLPTCVSFAVAMACDVLVRRQQRGAHQQFSPAYLHLASGKEVSKGRTLDSVLKVLHDGLPGHEKRFPYGDLLSGRLRQDQGFERIRNAGRGPIQHPLDVREIAKIKAYLAAGWVVVVTTSVGEQFRSPAVWTLGLPLLPRPGEPQIGHHAWALVGYDSVDGALAWKYQGRFLALGSWGDRFGREAPHGPGTVTLPFSFVYNRGMQAVALRLPDRGGP